MMRFLYVQLLRMHPATFRGKYAAEMLWIYEETERSEGSFALLVDGVVSLLRQWFLRWGLWRFAAAAAGAVLQAEVFGRLWFLPRTHAGKVMPSVANAPIDMAHLVVYSSGIVVVLVGMTALGVWNLRFRRLNPRARRRRVVA
ncbi:MAG TPA: hypothetical protein VGN01_18665 [Acidobacteriaceae bacterium]|jgi:hypothetical protein